MILATKKMGLSGSALEKKTKIGSRSLSGGPKAASSTFPDKTEIDHIGKAIYFGNSL